MQDIGITSKLLNLNSCDELRNSIISPYLESLNSLKEVYIFGAKSLGNRFFDYCTQSGINVLGFIDNDPQRRNTDFCGLKIYSLKDLEEKRDIPIIITSTTYLYEITEQLKNYGFTKILPHPVLSLYDNKKFPPEMAFINMQEDLVLNKSEYINFYDNLSDKKSRKVLNSLINFRLTLDFSYLKSIYENNSLEYFDKEIVKLNDNEVFVDGGGYNGDTTIKFLNCTNDKYNKIFFFEPDEQSFSEAKNNLNNHNKISFFNAGLYSKETTLEFNSAGTLDSCIDTNGNSKIKVVSIDNTIKDKITFIKLDVEGAEEDVLKGAKAHIKNDSPKLAIAGYHKSQDIWKLPDLIKKINPNYTFFIRHYTMTVFDTIIYAVPK